MKKPSDEPDDADIEKLCDAAIAAISAVESTAAGLDPVASVLYVGARMMTGALVLVPNEKLDGAADHLRRAFEMALCAELESIRSRRAEEAKATKH